MKRGIAIGAAVLAAIILMGQVQSGAIVGWRGTTNRSAVITTGGTFQTILASTLIRFSVTIQNNNPISGTEQCYLYIGSGSATQATSIVLGPGGSFQRYFPFIPSDAFQMTCTSNNDTVYADTQ